MYQHLEDLYNSEDLYFQMTVNDITKFIQKYKLNRWILM